jgi:hypothetical protein
LVLRGAARNPGPTIRQRRLKPSEREATNVVSSVKDRLGKSFGDNEIVGSERGNFKKFATEAEVRASEAKARERRAAGDSWGEG